jgi:octopine/nopaline transport system permease protein
MSYAQLSFFELMGFGPRGWGLTMLLAAGMTLAVAATGFLIGAGFGALAATARLSGNRAARVAADSYTTILRGVPDLLVIYLLYFGGSSVVTWMGSTLFGTEGFVSVPAFAVGALALGVCNGAYQGEVFRGGFLAIAKGEIEAGRAMGMAPATLFRRVIAPQVLRTAIPGLGNCWQLCLKESALITVTGLVELLRQSQIGSGSTRQPFSFYITAGMLYLVITTVTSWLFDRAEKRAMRGLRRA